MALQTRERNKLKANAGTAMALLLAVLAHLPALWSGLIWDDQIILHDQLVRFDSLADALLPPTDIPNWSQIYYRPLVVLSYLLDFGFLDEPGGVTMAHMSNVVFHVASTLLVSLLARRVLATADAWPAALATALFAVHPIHVESVNWISGRTDMLATLFVLAACLAALQWRDCRARTALFSTGVCVLLALMAKEVAVAVLGLIPALWWLAPRPSGAQGGRTALDRRFWLYGAAALILPVVLYLAARRLSGTLLGEPVDLPLVVMAIGLIRVLSWYALKLVMPWPPHNLVSWELLPTPVIGALIVLIAAGLLAIAAQYRRRSDDGLPLLAMAWIALAIGPSLWIAFAPGVRTPVAERYLYLPSVGLSLGTGWLLVRMGERWIRGVAVAAVLAGIVGTYAWGLAWTSDVRLWTYTTTRSPQADFAWHSLARAWLAAGDASQARAAYERGIANGRSAFDRSKMLYGLAEIELAAGDLDAAQARMQQSRREFPQFVRAGFGLGLIELLRAGEATDAEAMQRRGVAAREFRHALQQTPDFHEARIALAQVLEAQGAALAALGRTAEAQAAWREALREIAAVEAALPREQLVAYLKEVEPGVQRDPDALRVRIQRSAGASAGASVSF